MVRLSSRMHARTNVERTSEAQVRHATPLCGPTGTAGGCGPRRGGHRKEKQDRDADTKGGDVKADRCSCLNSHRAKEISGMRRDISAKPHTSAAQTQSQGNNFG